MIKAIGSGLVQTGYGTTTRADGSSFNVTTWEGLSSNVVGAYLQMVSAGYKPWGYTGAEIDATISAGKGRLELRSANLSSPQQIHRVRLLHNSVQKDILNAVPPYFRSLSDAQLQEVADFINSNGETEDIAFTDAKQTKLIGLIKRGVRYITDYQPVLIKTVEFPAGGTLALSFENVGCVLNTAHVINDAGVAGALRFGLPNYADYEAGWGYGWLKLPPEVDATRGSVDLVTQAYEYGHYSQYAYHFAS